MAPRTEVEPRRSSGGSTANNAVAQPTPNLISALALTGSPSDLAEIRSDQPEDATSIAPVRHHPAFGDEAEPHRPFRRAWPLVLTDLVSIFFGLTLGLLLLSVVSNARDNSSARLGDNLIGDMAFLFFAVLMLGVYGLYRHRHRRLRQGSFRDLTNLVHAMAVGAIATLGVSALNHRLTGSPEVSYAQLIVVAICATTTVPAGRAFCWWLRTRSGGAGNRKSCRVLVVGSGMMVDQVRNYFAADLGVEIVGCADDDPVPGCSSLGSIADLPRLCTELHIDRVLIGFSKTHPHNIIEQLRPLQGKVAISIIPRYFELVSWRSEVDDVCGLPVVDVAPPQLNLWARFVKRTVDVAVASLGLAILSPLLPVIALAIKLSSPGPLIFSQLRAGRDGRPFTIYKFRTMRTGAESERQDLVALNEVDGPLFKIRKDPRVFAFGRFLRRTSLDEIPQLFNVLRGHMSLVGPRPFILSESAQIDGWAARRFEVRPGLSGLWQISGRNDLSFDELRRLDYVYVASWSLWWDLKIIWHTPGSLLKRRGAY